MIRRPRGSPPLPYTPLFPPRNFWMQRPEPKNPPERTYVGRDRGTLKIGGKIPPKRPSFRSRTVFAVREDWVVNAIWPKLAPPTAAIRPSLRTSSQEPNFLLQ